MRLQYDYSQLLPSGACLLLILISGTMRQEGVALPRKEGLPCLMAEGEVPLRGH
jgi:hypothetical protein